MATRLLLDVLGKTPMKDALIVTPVESSGVLTASTVIKDEAGWLAGVLVYASDTGADQVINVWDSPDSTTTGDVELVRISVGATTIQTEYWVAPGCGYVHAQKGIYVAVAGDADVIVYYL